MRTRRIGGPADRRIGLIAGALFFTALSLVPRSEIGAQQSHLVIVTGISGGALTLLKHHNWPGNIRELENAMERAVALERTPMILPDSLPEQLNRAPGDAPAVAPADAFPDAGFDLERHVQGIEREYIAEALRRAGGVKVKAAELLGMSFRSFRYYTKKYNLK